MRFNIEIIPIMFWRCPICQGEETLSVGAEGIFPRRQHIVCDKCGAKWTKPSESGMTLVEGSTEHQGRKTLDEWATFASGHSKIEGLGASKVPILLNKNEKVIKIGWAELVEEKTFTESNRPFFGGVSIPVGKGVRVHTGRLFGGRAKTITQDAIVDEGDFILTDKRLVFNGGKKTINMNLTKIIGIGVESGFLMVGYGQRTRTFQFPSESVLKWEYYVRAVGEIASTGRQSVELPAKETEQSEKIEFLNDADSPDQPQESGEPSSDLERLAKLIKERNANEVKITEVIGRPAQIGHIGEYLASAIFSVKLEESATHPGHDGCFSEGDLSGKTVNVKMYGKREGLLDINEKHIPNYYLVFTGEKSSVMTSRGRTRPWAINEVFLFQADELVERLRSREIKIGVATSVRQEEWENARIYPSSPSSSLELTKKQQQWLHLFGA